jgi:HEPN domain-containing protein
MGNKLKPPEEWFKQANYDLETANAMFETSRYILLFSCAIYPLKKP